MLAHIVCSIGYVEFRSIDLVEKALALSGTIVMGLPIMVQLTESERNKTHAGDGYVRLFLVLDTNVLTVPPTGAYTFRQELRRPMAQCPCF